MRDAWRPPEDKVREAYEAVWSALDAFRSTYREPNEAQTEDGLVVHVLDALGFARVPQTDAKRQGVGNVPDYTLFAHEDAKRRVARYLGRQNRRFYGEAIGIAEAKRWGRRLDSADRADPEGKTENPSQQVIRYLGAVQAWNGPLWGVLTDGKRWRLYYQLADDRTAQFYEVDLETVCTGDYQADRDAFRYFYYFFRADAFVTHPRLNESFLQWVRSESRIHSERVEADLKARVFDRIFLHLARGFIHYRRQEKSIEGPEEPTQLAQVFGATMTLLYRLLFLLYAEDRDLLPVGERGEYWKHSLTNLKQEIAARFESVPEEPTGADAYELWERLQTLFRAVRRGSPDWNVPRYNGGLFSEEGQHNEFLETHRVPDDYLTHALYQLCRDEEDPDGFIDYKDLEVRQLGSIYEGLLEFHLEWADRDLVVLKDGNRYYYEDAAKFGLVEGGRRRRRFFGSVSEGELYLVNDRRERRATGSVFTPSYIVAHIVKKTVGPALEERLSHAEELLQEQPESYANEVLNALLGLRVLDPAMGSGHFLVHSLDHLSDCLAEWLATQPADNPVTETLEDIRTAILGSLRQQRMSDQFVTAAEDKLTDNNLLKRLLMKKCLYGVDYNPMAVELAKLSLWLDAFTLGAPLSFLDHHLRCGNSLVGADWDTLLDTFTMVASGRGKRKRTQVSMDGVFFEPVLDAARHMDELASLTDSSFADVELSAGLYSQYYAETEPYRKMLDLWVSEYFGNNMPRDQLRTWGPQYASYLTQGEEAYETARTATRMEMRTRADGQKDKVVAATGSRGDTGGPPAVTMRNHASRAEELASTPWLRFFHWEIEFPEVYFKDRKRAPDAGFDVVLGNPPYIKYQNRDDTPEFKRWYKERFTSAHGNYDVYVLFVEQALRLLRPGGRHGYIVYNKWIMSEYGQKLRQLLAERRAALELVDFGDNQVFPGHTTYTCLLFTEEAQHDTLRYTLVPRIGNEDQVEKHLRDVLDGIEQAWVPPKDGATATLALRDALQPLQLQQPIQTDNFEQSDLSDEPWEFAFGYARLLRHKVRRAGTALVLLTRDQDTIFQGLITSADSVYIVQKVKDLPDGRVRVRSQAADAELDLEAGLLRPLVSGEDVDRYAFLPTAKLILFPYLVQEDGAHLMSPEQLSRYQRTWRYLRSHEQQLRSRESRTSEADGGGATRRPFDDDTWYRYGRHQALDKQGLPKLCVAETVAKLEVALDFEGQYSTHNVRVNSIVLLKGASRDTYLYFLALLNSRLLDWFFKSGPTGRHAQGHYAANKQFIQDLPIYVPRNATPEQRRARLLQELKARSRDAKSDADLLDLCGWCDSAFLIGDQRADDVAREALAWLARRMERGMKARQKERAGFLTNLSRDLGADWEGLSGRTNLARYDEGDLDKLLDILGQPANVARYKATAQLGFRGRSRALREAIEREYEKSVRKLRRRQATLDRDQRLIDHIVYRLYGLRDNEVTIVEAGP